MTTTRTKILVAAALSAALSLPALAAEPAQSKTRFGLGVALFPIDAAATMPTLEVYVPIALSDGLRLEPSLGIFTRNRGGNGTDTSDFTLGVGLLVVSHVGPSTNMLYGGRLKLNFASASTPGAGSDSGTDVSLAGAFGAEQILGERFAVGLEAQLGYYSQSTVSGDASGLFTTGVVFVRVWF